MKNTDIKVAEKTWVDLRNCTREALESLPDGLRVGGNLILYECENLKTLPSGLVVGRALYLDGCENLEALPSGLVVGGGLYLDGCENLMDLPRDLQVGGNIWYNDYTEFAQDTEKLEKLRMRFPEKLKKY